MTTNPPAAKHARDMTDSEFAEATRRRAWRPAPPAPPRTDLLPAERALVRERVANMTDTEFREANRRRQWRDPESLIPGK